MASTNKYNGSVSERVFSAISALCFGSVMVAWLITMVLAKELTNVLSVIVLMITVIVMILNQKNTFAMVGIGIFALWKIITFFTGGSITAMWFELAAAIALLYLTFLVSRRAATPKDLRSASLFGWVPGVLALVGFFFYLSYACNGIAMRYWIYSIQNGAKMNLHYIGLELIEVLGMLFAGLWTAFTPVPADETPAAEDTAETVEAVETVESAESAEANDATDTAAAEAEPAEPAEAPAEDNTPAETEQNEPCDADASDTSDKSDTQ